MLFEVYLKIEEAFNDIFICIMYNYGEKGIALFLCRALVNSAAVW